MGNHRSEPQTTKHSVTFSNHRMDVVATGMCGWRMYMEDAHICDLNIGDGNTLFAVFDGHGGPEVSQYVSQNLLQVLKANPNYKSKNYEQALIETYIELDKSLTTPQGQAAIKKCRIDNQARNNASSQETSQAGCTAVTCLVTQNQIIVANAGDSRCFLSVNGRPEDMSFDHKPTLPQQQQRIENAGGQVTDGRVMGNLNLSRAIGDLQYKTNENLPWDEQLIISRPDIKKYPLKGVQYIVLGCDGLFEVKSNKDILDLILIRERHPLKETVDQILDALLGTNNQGQYGLDNMTMIVAKLK